VSAADSKQATVQREADFAATREVVVRGLSAHNEARVGPRNAEPLALSLRDETGAMVGGLIGELKWEWLYVDLFWIDEAHRGAGHGRRCWRWPSRRRAIMAHAASISAR
jgi:hypothetical protein